jgi:pentatricopeptide repeat protein
VPDSDGDDDDKYNKTGKTMRTKEIDKNKLPPPYDPFSKKPVIEEPKDPKDLQEIFHNMRTQDGLLNNAVKMFDALSKDGLTHEALELFAQIKDKGHMPDVVAHTAVIEAYANAGQPKEALKVYLRMLASGVAPNAYTYTVLIKGLAADANYIGDAKQYLMEMMGKRMRPNAGTYTAVFEALAKEQKLDEAREYLEQIKSKGFVPDEKSVRGVLNTKRGQVFRAVINILFGK